MADRLRDATSPYLLQHADNPVDWWQWGEEAFAEARRRDVPVLLSVGYSACHWCHVMAHESFEDPATARLVNDLVVPVKVDREERPDVDAVYMAETQAMAGQGGWPMTVFMTPDREPFYSGTYYPREHFKQLIMAVARAWGEDGAAVVGQAGNAAGQLAGNAGLLLGRQEGGGSGAGAVDREIDDAAVTLLAKRYDVQRGGFGGAPKFPPSTVLEFLLRASERAPAAAESAAVAPAPRAGEQALADQALAMAAGTAEAMARGGIYDQLGGGFARYSVDAAWVVPHFEKMLYDNAQLARVYALWWRRSGGALARRITEQTCDWMIADLRTAEGGFASALDGDSDGEEGAFYVWTPAELVEVLGPDDGNYAAQLFAVTEAGTFERGRSVLQLPVDPADPRRYRRVRARRRAAPAGSAGPADSADGPTPSGTYAIAGALLSYAALTGSARHREAAVGALGTLRDVAARFPQGAGWGLAVAEAFLAGPDEIAVVGPRGDDRTRALQRAAMLGATPGAVIAIGDGTGAGDPNGADASGGIPLLAGRGLVQDQPAAYVCRNFSCRLPVTSADELLAALCP